MLHVVLVFYEIFPSLLFLPSRAMGVLEGMLRENRTWKIQLGRMNQACRIVSKRFESETSSNLTVVTPQHAREGIDLMMPIRDFIT